MFSRSQILSLAATIVLAGTTGAQTQPPPGGGQLHRLPAPALRRALPRPDTAAIPARSHNISRWTLTVRTKTREERGRIERD